MAPLKTNFLDKVLGRIGRMDTQNLQTVLQRLARERRFLETLFNIIEDGVMVVDKDGKVIYLNSAAIRLLGLTAESAEGQSIARLLPELDWEQIAASEPAADGRKAIRHEFEIHYPKPRLLRLYAAPLDGGSAGGGMALVLNDATEARQQTNEAIESERSHSLTMLAASVAHEIGNPLNALHIHLQLMGRELKKWRAALPDATVTVKKKGREPGPAAPLETEETISRLENYLEVSRGEIARLDYIITQFLNAIRPSQPRLQPADLNDSVRETLALLGPELANRGIVVKEKYAGALPKTSIDPAQIKQALVNLVKNAMQAMTRGGVLTLQTGEGSEGVWVSVGDTGCGIPEEVINRIFEPFYTTKKKGTGLGLMIVQRIVREHHGRIEVESREGKGTAFRIWLPLHEQRPRLLEVGGEEKSGTARTEQN